jgi:hypothetical protein
MTPLTKVGKRLDNITRYILDKYPQDKWVLSTIIPMFLEVIKSSISVKEEQLIVTQLNKLIDSYEFRYNQTFEILQKSIREVLNQINEKEDRCKRIADRKYDKPSAYKSGAIVRCRKGNIWKDLKEEKESNIQDLAYKQIPGLLEKGINYGLNHFKSFIKSFYKWSGIKDKNEFFDFIESLNGEIKRVPLNSIIPSQKGKDYKNASSEHEAEEFQKILNGEKNVEDHRKEDFYPIVVNKKDNKIIDGNHRHYALSAIKSPYAVVLYVDVSKEYLSEVKKETLRTWFKRKGAPGKEGGWVDCNSPIHKDGKITGYKTCGRKEGEKRAKYPSCRPTPAQCKSPGKGTKWGKTK